MVWTGGNLINVDLEADLGAGVVTIEMTGSYDTKKSLERHFALNEASDLIFHFCTNNLVDLTLDNNEPGFGSAGDKAMDNVYTYNANDEVETLNSKPSLFEDDNSTYTFRYDCSVGINNIDDDAKLAVYPNPTLDKLNIIQLGKVSEIAILNVTGKVIYSRNITTNTHYVNTSNYSRGVYFVRITSEGETQTRKFIKK